MSYYLRSAANFTADHYLFNVEKIFAVDPPPSSLGPLGVAVFRAFCEVRVRKRPALESDTNDALTYPRD